MSTHAAHREQFRASIERAFGERSLVQCVGGGHAPRDERRQPVSAPDGVLDFWPKDLVVRVGAATTFDQLDAFLAGWDFDLGVAVGDPARRTLGGAFAAARDGCTGPQLRELTLSALVINGRGEPFELGARVVKNVAGYDLLRLHYGAGGSLGAISDLLLRVRARPRRSETRRVACRPDAAIESLLAARRAAPNSTSGEFYLDSGAWRALGVEVENGQGGWLFFAEGGEAEIECWSREVGGLACSVHPADLIELDAGRGGWTVEVFLSPRLALERWSRALVDAAEWWWVDARRGVLRLGIHPERWSRLRFGSTEPAFLMAGEARDLAPAAADPTDSWHRRLREFWDPGAIFPPRPRSLP